MNLQIQKIIFALNFIMIMQMTVQVQYIKDKDDSFIEQPYSGIWKLKNEIFDNISENLIE